MERTEHPLCASCKIPPCNLRQEDYMETAYRNDRSQGLRTFIRVYSLFKIERLSTNIKLTLHKGLTTLVMSYACPAWEFAAGTHF
jgi:hypothetical protein